MAQCRHYEILEHTADIRVRVTGATLKQLFCNAAQAMFDIVTGAVRDQGIRKKTALSQTRVCSITVSAATTEELLVNWLNELLSLFYVRKICFSHFTVHTLKQNWLKASVRVSAWAGKCVQTEVKAATYHELSVKRTGGAWKAEVIFDV